MKHLLKKIIADKNIDEADAENLMAQLMAGSLPPELVGALVVSLNYTPLHGKVLAGFARALLAQAQTFKVENHLFQNPIDVCGTGGDDKGSFNVSTAVAFLTAACGQPVAKHGGRAVSSRCGSFDVLEALGVPFTGSPSEAIQSLKDHNLTFMYAPSFHPALRGLAHVRQTLGVRTVFNILGPLLNPARVRRQLLGVSSTDLLIPVSEALSELATEEAFVVAGTDGTDEISLCAPTKVAHLRNGNISISTYQPEDFGFYSTNPEALLGGTAQENARILADIFAGQKGPRREIVLMNTAAALVIGGQTNSLKEAVQIATATLDAKKARGLLDAMRSFSTVEVGQ